MGRKKQKKSEVTAHLKAMRARESRKVAQKQREAAQQEPEEIPQTNISRRAKKKLAQIAAKKEAQKRRNEIYEQLRQHQATAEELKLMHSATHVSKKATKREQLRRDMLHHKKGILDEDGEKRLFTERKLKSPEPEQNSTEPERTEPEVTTTEPSYEYTGGRVLGVRKRRRRKVVTLSDVVSNTDVDNLLDDVENADTNEKVVVAEDDRSDGATDQSDRTTDVMRDGDSDGDADGDSDSEEETQRVPRYIVRLRRSQEIQDTRAELPVVAEESRIVSAIRENLVTVVCGATGSGKTTQVPQFLYEHGFAHGQVGRHYADGRVPGMIGVTQPRRVAAVAMARRVAEEMGFRADAGDSTDKAVDSDTDTDSVECENDDPECQEYVQHQVRFDSAVTEKTRVKFCTDGVLLREIQHDFLLRKYSVIIIDEAHERNVNTDVLIALLSRVVPLRHRMSLRMSKDQEWIPPLRLVVMSATLRVSDFTQNTRLFSVPPPVVEVDARRFPVVTHFARRTELDDYPRAAFDVCVKIHNKLPQGGVLVFLTGSREVQTVCHQLRNRFRTEEQQEKILKQIEEDEKKDSRTAGEDKTNEEEEDLAPCDLREWRDRQSDDDTDGDDAFDAKRHNDNDNAQSIDGDADDVELIRVEGDVSKLSEAEQALVKAGGGDLLRQAGEKAPQCVRVLPLYAALSQEAQMEVFKSVPPHVRLIVVSTNVAETSLTIPGIRYVVDCGREKVKKFDPHTGMSRFVVDWCSKASATQRAGRAGRTQAGHAYRLYSSAVFDQRMEEFAPPETLRVPIESLVLRLKSMGIEDVAGFPWPTPPPLTRVREATRLLRSLGAITPAIHKEEDERKDLGYASVTDTGRAMARLPVHARLAKALCVARHGGVIGHVIALVSALSVQSLFVGDRIRASIKTDEDNDEADRTDGDNDQIDTVDTADQQDIDKHLVSPLSDAVTAMRCVMEFERARYNKNEDLKQTCQRSRTRMRAQLEASDLRRQLTHIVRQVASADAEVRKFCVSPQLLPDPSEAQERLLRQILCACMIDNVARKYPKDMRYTDEEGRVRRVPPGAYQLCRFTTQETEVSDFVFIHPSSALFERELQPEYIVFQELTKASNGIKTFVRGITAIRPEWLLHLAPSHMTKAGDPLMQPVPRYNVRKDDVECSVVARFGDNFQWTLPPQRVPCPPGNVRRRCLALALLSGVLCPSLVQYKVHLKVQPDALLSVLALCNGKEKDAAIRDARCVRKLLSRLEKSRLQNRQQLAVAFRRKPSFLLQEYLDCLADKDTKIEVKQRWPPAVAGTDRK